MRKRIRKSVIEDYCFYSEEGSSGDLSWDDKLGIVRERIAELRRTEWQRWFPLWGTIRQIVDRGDESQMLLDEFHAPLYERLNFFYNTATTASIIGAGIFAYFR
ncbi:MAG: hypothetical protein KGH55_02940 [Nanoarchaeota archaeon]|nr:hypothetical protein [Nanoarchaeota archaeon]